MMEELQMRKMRMMDKGAGKSYARRYTTLPGVFVSSSVLKTLGFAFVLAAACAIATWPGEGFIVAKKHPRYRRAHDHELTTEMVPRKPYQN
ncbi:hypothetical protein BKA58DRAFT_393633 [Alternaria rosae]|uniref:uncharacterized protein n=1 Tax=Alternaria rosae TaxID=1187941 RepID=UPI001E8DBDC3|nr:uncharacterized protein BKA58DRAFT_393633 [Alternaria rosae]KAH6859121.1 hypothetical protein BKA58DRAFT_393633 [Alternaria rosae]